LACVEQNESDIPQVSQKVKQQADSADVVLILQESEIRVMIEQFIDQSIPYQMSDGNKIYPGITIIHGQYDEGFEAINEKLIVYTSKELFSTTFDWDDLSTDSKKLKFSVIMTSYRQEIMWFISSMALVSIWE
jgi:hypothetical protein